MQSKQILFGLAIVACSSTGAFLATRAANAIGVPDAAGVPIQGCVMDSAGNPVSGSHNVVFALYASETGGTALFTEPAHAVNFKSCIFSETVHPDPSIFRDNASVYLGIKIDADSELSPRIALGYSPYAAQAKFADQAISATTAASATSATTAGNGVPPGAILAFAGTVVPNGWLWCDGAAVSRTTYPALYAAIGTAHGYGDNTTTFNLPDYQGRFLRGVDHGKGRDPDRASRTTMATGGNVGDAVGTIQSDAFASHSHTQSWPYYQWGDTNSSGVSRNNGNPAPVYPGPTTDNAGGNETRPVNAAVNYIIKY